MSNYIWEKLCWNTFNNQCVGIKKAEEKQDFKKLKVFQPCICFDFCHLSLVVRQSKLIQENRANLSTWN